MEPCTCSTFRNTTIIRKINHSERGGMILPLLSFNSMSGSLSSHFKTGGDGNNDGYDVADQYSAPRVMIASPMPMKMTMKTPPILWIEMPPLLSSASSQAWEETTSVTCYFFNCKPSSGDSGSTTVLLTFPVSFGSTTSGSWDVVKLSKMPVLGFPMHANRNNTGHPNIEMEANFLVFQKNSCRT